MSTLNNTAQREEILELTETLLAVQKLPPLKRVAIKIYIRGMLDNRLIHDLDSTVQP